SYEKHNGEFVASDLGSSNSRSGGKKVHLVLTPFWVQIHNVPIGLFSKNLATQLGNFLGNFMEYDVSYLRKENRNFMRIRA
ncbi:hypothetical protein Goklo_029777, partial [Gossypium klotzschianum]|nr:hypothetical protein [Gossypium klotzschianum]